MDDNKITARYISPKIAVFAIHGGKIEPGTDQLAEDIAGTDLSLYIFKGESFVQDHSPSTQFNEPQALALASRVETIVSIHGEKNEKKAFVIVGGLHEELARAVEEGLLKEGFIVKPVPSGLSGNESKNICNRGNCGKGVQIEVSRKLRRDMRDNKEILSRFVNAVRQAIRPQ
ncbi:MAG: poly-gamma-glutamate hydrolase family protein [Patescibacteria group bacterium]|nr:poly-gamma-glutamate hydrolase family protein [Patescibacteria group bacterium]